MRSSPQLRRFRLRDARRGAWSRPLNVASLIAAALALVAGKSAPAIAMVELLRDLAGPEVRQTAELTGDQVEYTRTDKTKGVLYIDGIIDNDKKQNINLSWSTPNNIVSQTLEYSIETSIYLCIVPNKNYFYSCDFDGRITRFRFSSWWIAEGFSNEVKPLYR